MITKQTVSKEDLNNVFSEWINLFAHSDSNISKVFSCKLSHNLGTFYRVVRSDKLLQEFNSLEKAINFYNTGN